MEVKATLRAVIGQLFECGYLRHKPGCEIHRGAAVVYPEPAPMPTLLEAVAMEQGRLAKGYPDADLTRTSSRQTKCDCGLDAALAAVLPPQEKADIFQVRAAYVLGGWERLNVLAGDLVSVIAEGASLSPLGEVTVRTGAGPWIDPPEGSAVLAPQPEKK